MARLTDLLAGGMPLVRLPGERIFLRPPDRDDWAAWAGLRAFSREFLTPWEPTWAEDGLTKGAFRRRLARYAADWRRDEGYSFLLIRASDGTLLGGIGLTNLRRGVAEAASLGYWIGQPHARQGYMTEAIGLLLRFAFERLQLHRIEAACLPANERSRGTLLKAGFVEEGRARKYLCIDGAWQDHVLYAILREDWLTQSWAGPTGVVV